MPRSRNLLSLFSTPVWLLDKARGSQQLALMATELHRRQEAVRRAEAMQADEGQTPEARANYWREVLIDSGLYPYYVLPTGKVVHSLDPQALELLQPGSIAVVPVNGVMVKEASSWEELWWGLVSSSRLVSFQQHLLTEERVVGVVKVYSSPGGMVDGTEGHARSTRTLSAAKPTVGVVNNLAASAAYWDASQLRTILLDGRTSEVGSVGVMMSLWDMTAWLESIGIRVWDIYADESNTKNEGWRKLTGEKDPTVLKEELGYVAGIFQEEVRSGRGDRLGNDPASLTGRVYPGQLAIDVGMADGFGDLAAAITSIRSLTNTGQIPVNDDPSKPEPIELEIQQNATQHPAPMSIAKRIAALFAGIFGNTEEVTQADIDAANQHLDEQGQVNVRAVSAEQFAQVAAHATTVADLQAQVATLTAERDTARTELGTAQAQVATLTTERDAARTELTAAQAQVATLTTERDAARTELSTAQTRVAELERAAAPASTATAKAGGDLSDEPTETEEERQFREAAEKDMAKQR